MIELIRNFVAFASTFIVIATVTVMILHAGVMLIGRGKRVSDKQERLIVYAGIAVATVLIPFYYLPC